MANSACAPSADTAKKVRNSFTAEEDAYLVSVLCDHQSQHQQVAEDCKTTWHLIAHNMNQKFRLGAQIQLNGKKCRERYLNHVDPSLDKSPFTEADERILIELHRMHANKWAEIARDFPLNAQGRRRAENDVKNIFKSCQRNNKTGATSSGILATYIRSITRRDEETATSGKKTSSAKRRPGQGTKRQAPAVGGSPHRKHSLKQKKARPGDATQNSVTSDSDTLATVLLTIGDLCAVGPEDDVGDDCVVQLANSPTAGCVAGHNAFSTDRPASFFKRASLSPTLSVDTHSSCESSHEDFTALVSSVPVDSGESCDDSSSHLSSPARWLDVDGLMEPNDIPLSLDHLESSSTDAWRLSLLMAPCPSFGLTALSQAQAAEAPPRLDRLADLRSPAWRSASTASVVEQCDAQTMDDDVSTTIRQWTEPFASDADVADQLAGVLGDDCSEQVADWGGHHLNAIASEGLDTASQIGSEVYADSLSHDSYAA